MARRLPTPCRAPRCPNLCHGAYCDDHAHLRQNQQTDERRGTSTARGYDARFRRARAVYLAEHPLCVECLKEGHAEPSTVLDHIVPHHGQDDPLFWDQDNWQALCASHHGRKTVEDTRKGLTR